MKKRIFILSIALSILLIIGGCKKNTNAAAKTGNVIFSTTFTNGDISVTIHGETKTFESYLQDSPACGTVSTHCASFSLPIGTYNFTMKCNQGFPWGEHDDYYSVTSVTITEGGCTNVRW